MIFLWSWTFIICIYFVNLIDGFYDLVQGSLCRNLILDNSLSYRDDWSKSEYSLILLVVINMSWSGFDLIFCFVLFYFILFFKTSSITKRNLMCFFIMCSFLVYFYNTFRSPILSLILNFVNRQWWPWKP